MILQTYVSDPIQYRTLCTQPAPYRATSVEPGNNYNGYLCTTPRRFREGNFSFQNGGLLTLTREFADSDFAIWVLGLVNTTYWPSYDYTGFELNGRTGAFSRNIDPYGASALSSFGPFKQDRSGAVWGFAGYVSGAALYLFDIDVTLAKFLPTSVSIPYSFFEGGVGSAIGPDMHTGILLTKNSLTPNGYVTVLSLATGAILRHLPCGGVPIDINWEDGNRAYIICANGTTTLLDVVTGEVVSVMHHVLPTGSYKTSYAYPLKRLLSCQVTPDAADGSSTVVVRGFKFTPQATRLTKPVALAIPRVGQQMPATTRLVGDIGEPVSGGVVYGALDNANGTLQNEVGATGIYGYANFAINCTSAGNTTLTVTTET